MRENVYVLVHGAYHGGWCWRDVAAALRARGHRVFTPTLTGLGERAHLLAMHPDLYTHIEDIVQVILTEELHDVILVGHSYAGSIITGVADRIPEKIAHLVYLDALILQAGAMMIDAMSEEKVADFCALLPENGGSGAIPIPPVDFFGVFEPAQIAWLDRRLTPQPVKTFFSVMELKHPSGSGLPATYIVSTNPYFRPAEISRDFAKTQRRWKYAEIDTGHDAMITAPRKVAELLAQIV